MSSRLSALLIWAAVAASLAYWGLRWLAQPIAVPANAVSVSMDSGSHGDLRRLLSGPAVVEPSGVNPVAQSALAGRIQLQGAFAANAGSEDTGVALLSVDGQPARAVRVGQTVDGDMVLQGVDAGGARIGPVDGDAVLTLALPTLPSPNTGTLPPATGVSPAPGAATPMYQPPQDEDSGRVKD
jgi:general secretion pathway protein C